MVNSLLDWFKVRNYEENIHLVLKFNLDGVGIGMLAVEGLGLDD